MSYIVPKDVSFLYRLVGTLEGVADVIDNEKAKGVLLDVAEEIIAFLERCEK